MSDMQMSLNLMICCLMLTWHGILGSEGCDDVVWPLVPKYLTDLIVQVLLRSTTVMIVYEDKHKDRVSQVVAELHRNSLNPVVQSLTVDTPHNQNRSLKNLLHILKVLTLNQSTRVYVVGVCFVPSVLKYFLRSPIMQRHITGRILDAQDDFSHCERWIFLGSYPDQDIFANFSYAVVSTIIKKLPDRTAAISVVGSYFLENEHRETRILSTWNISGFEIPLPIGLMDEADKRLLENQRIRVAHLEVFPFFSQSKTYESDLETIKLKGMEYKVVSTIAEYYGFQLEYILTPDGNWGHRENNTWFGLVGMVHRHEADIAVTCFSQTFERMAVIDYAYPHYFDPVVFVTKAPKLRSRAFLIFKPFPLPVIMAVVSTALCTACLIYATDKFSTSFRSRKPKWGLFSAVWFVFGSLTLKGDGVKPTREASLRILICSWWVFTIVMMSAFAGVLVSCLNVPSMEDSIDTLESLNAVIDANQVFPSTLRSSSIATNFLNSRSGILFKIGQKMRDNPQVMVKTVSSGLELTLRRSTAFIFPRDLTAGQAVSMGKDNFHFSREGFYTAMYSIGIPKGSPLKILFTRVIRKLSESGIINRWSYITLMKKRVSTETNISSSTEATKRLTWKEMQGTFLILAVGYGLSILALIVEKVIRRLEKQSVNKCTKHYSSRW